MCAWLPFYARCRESSDQREIPVSSSARAKSGRLAALGRGGLRQGAAGKQAHLPLGRLLDLPLVPRHGARVFREREHGRDPEREFCVHQSRPRGAAGRRSRLHDFRAGHHGQRRLAPERVADAGAQAIFGRHLFSARGALRSQGISGGPARHRGRLARRADENCRTGRHGGRRVAQAHQRNQRRGRRAGAQRGGPGEGNRRAVGEF